MEEKEEEEEEKLKEKEEKEEEIRCVGIHHPPCTDPQTLPPTATWPLLGWKEADSAS